MRDSTRQFYQEAVRAAVTRIAGALDDALDLAGLSAASGVCALHFHRIFKGMSGETLLELHRRLRLERAAWRLATSAEAVTAIAFDAGFETHESFTRAFQAAYAEPPSAFRRRIGEHRAAMGHEHRFPFEIAARSGVHFSPSGAAPDPTFTQGGEDMDVAIDERGEMRLAALTHVGPRNQVGQAFGRVAAAAGPAGLFARPGAMAAAVFHGDADAIPAAELRTSAGVIVPDGVTVPAGLEELIIPAGTYARTIHKGHYAGLPDAWNRLMGEWLPASGRRAADRPTFEVYRVADHSRPDELETDLYLPLA